MKPKNVMRLAEWTLLAMLTVGGAISAAAQDFLWPALDASGSESVRVTQDYSAYNSGAALKFHSGIDIGATPQGATDNKVRASAGGTVHDIARVDDGQNGRGGWGNAIILSHPGGLFSLYGHMAAFAGTFTIGQAIAQGAQLGTMGSTGNATGVHLHFEIRGDGSFAGGYFDDIASGFRGFRDPRQFVLPSFAESTLTPTVVRVAATANVNVRSGPRKTDTVVKDSFSILTQIRPGQRFVAFKSSATGGDQWYGIYLPHSSSGISGWVAGVYGSETFVESDTAVDQIEVLPTEGLGVNIRNGAGTDLTEETKVKVVNGLAALKIWDGQRYPVKQQSDVGGFTWYEIDLPSHAAQTTGWVRADNVTLIPASGNAVKEFILR